jgi:hypothetical protein
VHENRGFSVDGWFYSTKTIVVNKILSRVDVFKSLQLDACLTQIVYSAYPNHVTVWQLLEDVYFGFHIGSPGLGANDSDTLDDAVHWPNGPSSGNSNTCNGKEALAIDAPTRRARADASYLRGDASFFS